MIPLLLFAPACKAQLILFSKPFRLFSKLFGNLMLNNILKMCWASGAVVAWCIVLSFLVVLISFTTPLKTLLSDINSQSCIKFREHLARDSLVKQFRPLVKQFRQFRSTNHS